MTYIKINETLYPATINGKVVDKDWDNRESKSITLEMPYEEANEMFVNGLAWSIVQQEEVPVEVPVYGTSEGEPTFDEEGNPILDEEGNPVLTEGETIQTGVETIIQTQETEWDNSEYSLAGDLTDHRDGTITVKMGKLTDLEEAYEIMFGGME